MFQDAIVQTDPDQAQQVLTAAQIAWNGLGTALVAMLTLYGAAYQRIGSDDFVFWVWLKHNRNRWINGVITLVSFYLLTWMIPDVSEFATAIGYNLNPKVPVASGLALAAWLSLSTKAKEPAPRPPVDPIP